MKNNTNLHGPARYQIVVSGQLDEQWADWFEGTISATRQGQTVLMSNVLDQSGLHGMLVRIRDLGLPLLSLHRLEPGSEYVHERRCWDE